MKKITALILLSLLSLFWLTAQADDDLLMPEDAYKFSASVVDANTVRAEWKPVKGYYMYRDKISFKSETTGITIGQVKLPKGKLHHGILPNGNEGEVEIFSAPFSVDIPLIRSAGAPSNFTLLALSQGCAEVGVCYPPIKQKATLQLPTAKASALSSLNSLSKGLGVNSDDDVLPPEQAFQFSANLEGDHTIVAHWTIADKHYLYRDKFNFVLKDASNVKLGKVDLPPGETKQDEVLKQTHQVFHKELEARIALQRGSTAASNVSMEFSYQGCAEERGICYPMQKKTETFALPAVASITKVDSTPAAVTTAAGNLSEQDAIAARLKGGGIGTILAFFGFGLLLAFTPCVFPMIPILSSIIVGQGAHLTTRRAFFMSLSYVLAMAVTYTVAGVFAGVVGENLQAAFQNPWILGSFAGVFLLLSLSMFGMYDLQMPSFIQSRLTEFSNKQQGGNLLGVAIMGFLSALIVGPCVAAPLAGALIYIGQTGDAVLGGLALFALSLGMGVPLLVIGTSAGKLLPRAGGWMDVIKAVFGVMMIAVAIWMLERILPETVTLILWGVLFIVSAIYMKAIEPLNSNSSGWTRLWKGVGMVLLIYGALLIIGASAGGKDTLQPLKPLTLGGGSTAMAAQQQLNFKRIKSAEDLQREVASASAAGKTVMMDFYADWCTYCKEYEHSVFPDPRVQQALANTVLLQADVTANDDADKDLMQSVKVPAPPSILFFGRDGKELRNMRLVGSMKADDFLAHVKQATK